MYNLSPGGVRVRLDELNIRPSKTLGQNFIFDGGTVRKIVRTANIDRDDYILEIGPGLGALTAELLQANHKVTAVEYDQTLYNGLKQLYSNNKNLSLLNADALSLTTTDLTCQPTHFISNLPYNTGIPILFHCLRTFFATISSATFMLQKEVALRLLANPSNKQYGKTTVKLALLGNITKNIKISRNIFLPKPNVDSLVLHWEKVLNKDLISLWEDNSDDGSYQKILQFAFDFVDICFANRRKVLASELKKHYRSQLIDKLWTIHKLNPQARAEELTTEQYGYLIKEIYSLN